MKTMVACVLMSCALLGCKKSDKDIEKELDKALKEMEKDMKADLAKSGGGGAGGTEAQLQLNKIGKNAKTAAVEQAQFPVGKVGPTPAKDCCESGGKCAPDPAAWSDATWKALDFSMDEAHGYQYSYESDGKTFTAKAIGCGDHAGTYTASGRMEAGNAVFEVTGP